MNNKHQKCNIKLNKFSANACWDGAFKNQIRLPFATLPTVHTTKPSTCTFTPNKWLIKSSYLTTQLILCACQYSATDSTLFTKSHATSSIPHTLLSSSNIANSHSNMPHTRTQHSPCTISKIIKESLPIGEKMANDMITLTHANCTATCTTHPALLLAPQLPMHVQNNCKNTRHCWQNIAQDIEMV